MLNELLRVGFQLANRRLNLIFLDLLWKVIWLALTLAGFLGVIVWFGTQFGSIQWVDTGNRALNTALALRILRELWAETWGALLWIAVVVIVFSGSLWFLLEAAFRSRFYSREGSGSFRTFLLSNLLKWLFLASASFTVGVICFGPLFATPITEWPQVWPDARGAAFISAVTIAALAFLLTIVDTLIRRDAVELFGTDLFRVTALVSILVSFEAMIVSACAIALAAGVLNVTSFGSAVGMMAAMAIAVTLLNILHSYLLLVRYSAVDMMRQNVVEI